MSAKYKLSSEDIAAIEETLSRGNNAEVRLGNDREIEVYEIKRTVIARE